MAHYQTMLSTATGLTSGEEKAKNTDTGGTKVSRPIFESWNYTDFALFDSAGSYEHVVLEEDETRAGGYPQELKLDDSRYDHNPPVTYCGNDCEHNIAHSSTIYRTAPSGYTASSVSANQGSASYIQTAEYDSHDETSRSFCTNTVTQFSNIYSTTSTLPADVSGPSPVAIWATTPEQHEELAYILQRPHAPASTSSSTHKHRGSHRSSSNTTSNKKNRRSNKRA